MMAIEGCLLSHVIIHQSCLVRKPVFGLVMLQRNKLSVKKTITLQARSSMRDQVFEDHSSGIVCYKDDRGEIVCEGFDEGPRIIPSTPFSLREGSILDFVPQRWLQILEGGIAKGDMSEEHTCNGFETLH